MTHRKAKAYAEIYTGGSMKGIFSSALGSRLILGLVLAALCAVALAAMASAQQSFEAQYGEPQSPAGPAANAQCTVTGDDDGVVNAGDPIVCAGNFSVSEGSSVVLQDSDSTQGTLIDGTNAEITEGSLIIDVSGEPANVNGGNEVLNTDGLFVVATTGVSEGGGSVLSETIGLLPDTGGPLILGALGTLAAGGLGLTLLRRRYTTP